jgi:hypothetical protein
MEVSSPLKTVLTRKGIQLFGIVSLTVLQRVVNLAVNSQCFLFDSFP